MKMNRIMISMMVLLMLVFGACGPGDDDDMIIEEEEVIEEADELEGECVADTGDLCFAGSLM